MFEVSSNSEASDDDMDMDEELGWRLASCKLSVQRILLDWSHINQKERKGTKRKDQTKGHPRGYPGAGVPRRCHLHEKGATVPFYHYM